MVATATRARVLDPVLSYAKAVTSWRIVAGPLVRLACERHIKDRKEGSARGLYWDLKAANHAIAFFGFLRLADAWLSRRAG